MATPRLTYGYTAAAAAAQAAAAVVRMLLVLYCHGLQIPRYWKFVDSFPMTASGKPQVPHLALSSVALLGFGGRIFGAVLPLLLLPLQPQVLRCISVAAWKRCRSCRSSCPCLLACVPLPSALWLMPCNVCGTPYALQKYKMREVAIAELGLGGK